ncbi:MAG: HAMP domain-containing histidine kinase [Firmicutes bacterium]|nr:HAMP domain-containing histidine kinase [Bacillota bacterium]
MPKKRIISLNHELAIVAILAFIIAVMSGVLLGALFNSLLDKHFATDEYYHQQEEKLLENLNTFISEADVTTNDWYKLNTWLERKKIVALRIYKDELLVYDSEFYKSKNSAKYENTVPQTENANEKKQAYKVIFEDGEADVIINGMYANVYYKIALVTELLIPCIIFMTIILVAVRKKVNYVIRLCDEVHIMEGGDLDYPITIKGRDELTLLAVSLDEFRMSFIYKLKEIINLQQESKALVTEMSHDMRTPMTPLLIYLGMLREKRYNSEEEMENYIIKSHDKATQLKNMSDNMFSYFLMDKDAVPIPETLNMKTVFYDQLSAMSDYLTESGFIPKVNIELAEVNINVNMDSIARIFDNIVSNILKYAEPSRPIFIKLYSENGKVIFHIGNTINALADYSASTGFGVKNIKKMMSQMSAECIISQKNNSYDTFLLFKIVSLSVNSEENVQI